VVAAGMLPYCFAPLARDLYFALKCCPPRLRAKFSTVFSFALGTFSVLDKQSQLLGSNYAPLEPHRCPRSEECVESAGQNELS